MGKRILGLTYFLLTFCLVFQAAYAQTEPAAGATAAPSGDTASIDSSEKMTESSAVIDDTSRILFVGVDGAFVPEYSTRLNKSIMEKLRLHKEFRPISFQTQKDSLLPKVSMPYNPLDHTDSLLRIFSPELQLVVYQESLQHIKKRKRWYSWFLGEQVYSQKSVFEVRSFAHSQDMPVPSPTVLFRDTLDAADTVGTGFCGIVVCRQQALKAQEKNESLLRMQSSLLHQTNLFLDKVYHPEARIVKNPDEEEEEEEEEENKKDSKENPPEPDSKTEK